MKVLQSFVCPTFVFYRFCSSRRIRQRMLMLAKRLFIGSTISVQELKKLFCSIGKAFALRLLTKAQNALCTI
jgi:hypothetical protein